MLQILIYCALPFIGMGLFGIIGLFASKSWEIPWYEDEEEVERRRKETLRATSKN